jgi:carboxy-cis,cis-muconate cyclase
MVDVFEVSLSPASNSSTADATSETQVIDGRTLTWKQGVKIIPAGKLLFSPHSILPNTSTPRPIADLSPTLFWADEVRISPSSQYLYASTRGLEPTQRGWVAVFSLLPSGLLASETPLALWETPTSGGWANAIEPAPKPLSTLGAGAEGGVDYLALTDSEEGLVMVLSWDGKTIEEVARVKLDGGAGAATAVWLD